MVAPRGDLYQNHNPSKVLGSAMQRAGDGMLPLFHAILLYLHGIEMVLNSLRKSELGPVFGVASTDQGRREGEVRKNVQTMWNYTAGSSVDRQNLAG